MLEFKKTTHRVITKRGVLWLGQTCNLRCDFCYFMDRINTPTHPEHPFMSIEKAKNICKTLVGYYHNNAIDIQGGEPTIYPHIYELVRYCRDIGLLPTLITNALVLDNMDNCKKLLDAGIRDCLVSLHGLGESYDSIVGVKGAHLRQRKGIENLRQSGIPIRYNCVLSKNVLHELRNVSEIAIQTEARVVNFIAFNPFEDQQKVGKRSCENVPSYREVSKYLGDAIDLLESSGIECNVRYFPMCMVSERHRKSIYNFQQLPYDIHEWDYASWSWTGMSSQRMRDGDTTCPISLEEATIKPVKYPGRLNNIAGALRNSLLPHPKLLNAAITINRKISFAVNYKKTIEKSNDDNDWLYNENAKMRAQDHCNYIYADSCSVCAARQICDGFHGDYAAIFGTDEATPVEGASLITDPKYYISKQEKVVECEDYEWAL